MTVGSWIGFGKNVCPPSRESGGLAMSVNLLAGARRISLFFFFFGNGLAWSRSKCSFARWSLRINDSRGGRMVVGWTNGPKPLDEAFKDREPTSWNWDGLQHPMLEQLRNPGHFDLGCLGTYLGAMSLAKPCSRTATSKWWQVEMSDYISNRRHAFHAAVLDRLCALVVFEACYHDSFSWTTFSKRYEWIARL